VTRPSEDAGIAADVGGPLLVTPAGTAVVSTDAVLASADRLRTLERSMHEKVRRVLAADAVALGWPIRDDLAPRLERVRARCEQARDAFGRAAEEYTRAEAEILALQQQAAGFLAALLGPALLGALARIILFQPGVLLGAALSGWAAIPDGPDGRLGTVRDFMLAHPELITSPEFVRFVSLVVTSIDDVGLGLLGVPAWLAAIPGVDLSVGGDQGVAFGALTTLALGSLFGMFRETPVTAQRESSGPVTAAPAGSRERLDRIPEGSPVRIEKYEADGMPPRYVVYLGPTETFSPFSDDEPRDLNSNVQGVAGLDPGAYRVVELAMVDAGIHPGDEVVVSGFSQGGLMADLVIASGDWNVVGKQTFGAPSGNIPMPEGLFGMAVRNTDDFIPALAGPQLDHHVMQVEREAFAGDTPPPTALAAPAHQRGGYVETADAIDDADSAAVREQNRLLDRFTADYLDLPGGRATQYVYRGERDSG
jgi:hypothetical protein